MDKKVIKVAIGIPNEGHTLPEAYDNHLVASSRMGAWQEMMKHWDKSYRYELYWFTSARMLTQLARERLIEAALKGGCDFLIMYDDDMTLPLGEPNDYSKDMIPMMLEDMRKRPEIDVLGALAFMRNAPHYPVIYNTIEGWDSKLNTDIYIREYVKRYPKNTLVECDAVGFGGVCIRLDFVRKKLTKPYFMSTTGTGEDIWFCYRAKERGARIFMDTRIKLGHLKNPEIVDEAYFDKWIKDNKHDLGEEVPNKYLQKNR
jgi:GT2 family glycosyltransferase